MDDILNNDGRSGIEKLDDMPIQEVIRLYYEKHHAMQLGDMVKLLEIKKKVPELFCKENDEKIRDMILSIKCFQNSDRYKELVKLDMKNKLSVIDDEPV